MINSDDKLNDLIERLKIIKDNGWIQTKRAGNTGVGYTIETLLNIEENNVQKPDWHGYELKSRRDNVSSKSMLTMFTLSPLPTGSNTILKNKYGYAENDLGVKKLHTTLGMNRFTEMNNGCKLKLISQDEKIHISSDIIVEDIYWTKERIEKAFSKKIKSNIVLINADSRGSGSKEEFLFKEAFLLSGFSFNSFMDLIYKSNILIDLRIGQYANGRTHDHGTAFRIKESDMPLLFKNIEKLL